MSYFELTLSNGWSLTKARESYAKSYKDANVASQQMEKDLLKINKNPNYSSTTKKKVKYFLQHLSTLPNEADNCNSNSNSTSNSNSNSNSNSGGNSNESSKRNSRDSSSSNYKLNNQTFYMGNKNTVSNVFNNNGKRAADQEDLFNQTGGESSNFFNKLLKTYHEESNSSNNETEEEEEESIEEDVLDDNDDFIFRENIVYEEKEDDEFSPIIDSIKEWKAATEHQPLIHKQILLYYNIIDESLGDIPPLTSDCLDRIKSLETTFYHAPAQVQPLNLDFNSCSTFSRLRSIYGANKSELPYTVKKIIKTYLNQKYEENVNLFVDTTQKENDYKLHFIAPLYKALFRENELIKKEWGESMVGKTKVDGLLSALDEEGVVTTFSVVEVSGPWSVVCTNHFMQDKKKIAKNLKLFINLIYKLNIGGGSNIKKVKLFGLQIYQKKFYLYSLQCLCPKLYLFKEEMKFSYPTSPSFFRSQLPGFITNMITVKSLIESSLDNVLSYLNDDGATLPQEYCNDNKYIDSTENSPQKKKK